MSRSPGPPSVSQPLTRALISSSMAPPETPHGPGGGSASQTSARKMHLSSTSGSSSLSKSSFHVTLSSQSKAPCLSSLSSYSSSSTNDNPVARTSEVNNVVAGVSSSSAVDNGNVGESQQFNNNNSEQEGDSGGCSLREDERSRTSNLGNRSHLSPVIHSKLPVYRVVKGITNSNQLFHYRFSPV